MPSSGINFLLARRTDWATSCGVDLCNDLQLICTTEHHDSIWYATLEDDQHINSVEAHYAQAMEWLCQDGDECSSLILAGWAYDLLKYGTKDCIQHPYEYTDDYFYSLLEDTANCRVDVTASGAIVTADL